MSDSTISTFVFPNSSDDEDFLHMGSWQSKEDDEHHCKFCGVNDNDHPSRNCRFVAHPTIKRTPKKFYRTDPDTPLPADLPLRPHKDGLCENSKCRVKLTGDNVCLQCGVMCIKCLREHRY